MFVRRQQPDPEATKAAGLYKQRAKEEEAEPAQETAAPSYYQRQVVAAEALALAVESVARAVVALADAVSVSRPTPPPKAPAAAERPVAREKPVTKEDVRRAMVDVAKARGGDFLTATLKGQFGCESIAGLRPEQYEDVVAALVSTLTATRAGRAAK